MASLVTRRAQSGDRARIADLASSARRVVFQIPWAELESEQAVGPGGGTYDFYLSSREGAVVCACGMWVVPLGLAYLRVFCLDDSLSVSQAVGALLPAIAAGLAAKKVEAIAYMGVTDWLLEGLIGGGFVRDAVVLSMQKTDFWVPDPGNSEVTIRPVDPRDLPHLAELDRLAFVPVWRKPFPLLEEALRSHPYFAVAELEGEVVGYAYAYLQGRHGHLTRLAVHPRFHHRRIGARLLGDVVHFFERQRVYAITLNTQKDNRGSRRLYAWFGFVSLGKEADVLVYALS
jgi:ribosomal protein S18 acetylase RimI-like enzyme